MRRRGLLVVISGPAGGGKSTLAEAAAAAGDDINRAITATTRAPREGEVDGRDYVFLSEEEFLDRLSRERFAEYAEFNRHLYGTPKDELEQQLSEDRVVLLVIDVKGAAQIRRQYPHAIHVFILPPTPEDLRERLSRRGTESASDIDERLRIAESEIDRLEEYDYLLVNDDEAAAGGDLSAIIAMARAHRIRGGEREAWRRSAYAGWHAKS